MIWIMKLRIPTRIIPSRLTLMLNQSSFLFGLVASFRMRLLSLIKSPTPILFTSLSHTAPTAWESVAVSIGSLLTFAEYPTFTT